MFKIALLKDYPHLTETVSKWLTNAFGCPASIHFYTQIIEHSLNENTLPITFIAFDDEELIGTIGLWNRDFLPRQDLSPWCSALVVKEEYRSQGMGQILQNFAINYAQKLKYEHLYLYADFEGYYEKNGWEKLETGYDYDGSLIYIYQIDTNKKHL